MVGVEYRRSDKKKDAALIFLCMMILWPTGFDQIFPLSILIVWILYKIIFKHEKIILFSKSFSCLLLELFYVIFVISAFQVESVSRLITYSRDYMLYSSAIIVFFYFSNPNNGRELEEFIKLFSVVYFVMLVSCIIYMVYPFSFPSFAYIISPPFIKNSMMGHRDLVKSFGEQLYFYGFTVRISSFFSSPIQFSCIAVLFTPFVISLKPGLLWRLFVYGLTGFMLFMSQARLAMMLFLIFPFVELSYSVLVKRISLGFFVIFLFFLCAFVIILLVAYHDDIQDFLYELFFERRKGSAESRELIYSTTWAMIQSNPIFGYGTQLDMPGSDYPAGSHSTYLGLWFKQGIFGLSIMLCFFATVWGRLLAHARISSDREQVLTISSLSAFTIYLVILSVNEYIPDVLHTYILFMISGIFRSLQSNTVRHSENPAGHGRGAQQCDLRVARSRQAVLRYTALPEGDPHHAGGAVRGQVV